MDLLKEMCIRAVTKPHHLARCLRDGARARRLVGIPRLRFSAYLAEFLTSRGFQKHMRRMVQAAQHNCPDPRLGGWIDFVSASLIYAIVRHVRPNVVLETGVGPGGTTASILLALHRNNRGTLHSIDLPGNDAVVYPTLGKAFNVHIPEGHKPGWLVPPWLTSRWTLTLGDSREQLPKVLAGLGTVDVFLHDSLHTDEHVMMEFRTVWPHMSPTGVLLCDDVKESWSLAFLKFCRDRSIPHLRFKERVGVGILKGVARSGVGTSP
jgi:hypothetical protein